jgi:hypothetical protein
MKKITLTIIIFLMGVSFIKAQDELIPGELYIGFDNRPTNWEFTVKIEALGGVWGGDHLLTEEYPGGEVYYSSSMGLWFHASATFWGPNPYEPILGIGLYKVSIWEGNNQRAWFYLDYRTSDYPGSYNNPSKVDVRVDYDVVNKYFQFKSPINQYVVNGNYYALWDLHDNVDQTTVGLEDFWNNSVVWLKDGYNHPKIVWGIYPSHDYIIHKYYIYYSVHYNWVTPTNFVKLDSVNSSTFTYLDYEVEIGGGLFARSYLVKALIGDPVKSLIIGESAQSNYVTAGITDPNKINTQNGKIAEGYNLLQNFPNPFNPSTTITWQIPSDNHVSLKIYDVLGREICTLVDEFQESGIHQIEFNANGIPSGIYFYKLQSGSYSETRKLVLSK